MESLHKLTGSCHHKIHPPKTELTVIQDWCGRKSATQQTTSQTLQVQTMTLDKEESYNADGVPERFICPLTLEIMEHPLMTRAGHSFERVAILNWLRRNDKHPLTRESLSLRDLVQNEALKKEITNWKAKHGNILESETEASSSDDETDVCETLFVSTLTPDDLEGCLHYGHSTNAERPASTTTTAIPTAAATTITSTTMTTTVASSDNTLSPFRIRRPRFSLVGVRRRR